MPTYWFNLAFGDRILVEGVELPSRAAAREEALAVVAQLCNPAIPGNPRRWASWFLAASDADGEFLRLPLGYPALEVVGRDSQPARAGEMKRNVPQRARGRVSPAEACPIQRTEALAREIAARRARTEELLEANRQLRHELSSFFLVSERNRAQTRRVLSEAAVASLVYQG
jgi:hypothetical protein